MFFWSRGGTEREIHTYRNRGACVREPERETARARVRIRTRTLLELKQKTKGENPKEYLLIARLGVDLIEARLRER